MLKMFLVGLGTGYIVFTESGNRIVKKYMELSNSLASKGIDAVNNMIPKGVIEDESVSEDDE